MKNFMVNFARFIIGKRAAYRIGRALYLKGRGEINNDMSSNGEALIQQCVLSRCFKNKLDTPKLTVFDVGANIGDWSSMLRDLISHEEHSTRLRLYMFEPVPSTLISLKRRFSDENPNYFFEQIALSSESCPDIIFIKAPGAGTNSLHVSQEENYADKVSIMKFTLSDYCESNNIEHIHLLKCDVEGHDMEVIRGALPLLSKGRISVFQFEYNNRWIYSRNFLRDVFVAMRNMPYRLVKLHPEYLLILNEWHPELEKYFEGNYALIHEESLDWFPLKNSSWTNSNVMVVE